MAPIDRRRFISGCLRGGLSLCGLGWLFSAGCRGRDAEAQKPPPEREAIPEVVIPEEYLLSTPEELKKAGKVFEARHYTKEGDGEIQCHMCFRECIVSPGERGFCRNKENRGGKYYTLVYALPAALQNDPIEKEPSFHVAPGSHIFCTGTASCNNRCKFCHNWHLSQRSVEQLENYFLMPPDIVNLAKRRGCEALSFTYNEPTVFYEFMYDVARLGKKEGFKVLFHTNGSMQKKPMLELLKLVDAVTVDLKAFTEKFYERVSSSSLAPVLETLKTIKHAGVHLEMVNLMIPTLNDDAENIQEMCRWIVKNLGKDVPLHFTRFFPNYRLRNLPPTPISTLDRAHAIAKKEGIRFVYVGNAPGHRYNSTFCPRCGKRIIHRTHFAVKEIALERGKCRYCGTPIPGIWS